MICPRNVHVSEPIFRPLSVAPELTQSSVTVASTADVLRESHTPVLLGSFEVTSCSVAQASLELSNLTAHPPGCRITVHLPAFQ